MGLPVSRSHLVIDKMNCARLGRWKKIENAWIWGDERCKYSANEELPHTRRPHHLIRLSAFLWHFSQFQILQQRQRQKRVMERKNIHICKSLGYSLSVKNIRTSFGHRKKISKTRWKCSGRNMTFNELSFLLLFCIFEKVKVDYVITSLHWHRFGTHTSRSIAFALFREKTRFRPIIIIINLLF